MASGHVNRTKQAEHMAAPTQACDVKKVLANSEAGATVMSAAGSGRSSVERARQV
jgi:hypothetical protein